MQFVRDCDFITSQDDHSFESNYVRILSLEKTFLQKHLTISRLKNRCFNTKFAKSLLSNHQKCVRLDGLLHHLCIDYSHTGQKGCHYKITFIFIQTAFLPHLFRQMLHANIEKPRSVNCEKLLRFSCDNQPVHVENILALCC